MAGKREVFIIDERQRRGEELSLFRAICIHLKMLQGSFLIYFLKGVDRKYEVIKLNSWDLLFEINTFFVMLYTHFPKANLFKLMLIN